MWCTNTTPTDIQQAIGTAKAHSVPVSIPISAPFLSSFHRLNSISNLAVCCLLIAVIAYSPAQAQQPPVASEGQPEATDAPSADGSNARESSLDNSLPQEELEVFATAFSQMVELREEAKTDLAEVITSENLTPEQFLDIRDGNRDGVDREELARFSRVEGQVNQVRDNLEQDMQKVVEDEGMTVARFQEIFAAVEETPELQARLQQVWEERL